MICHIFMQNKTMGFENSLEYAKSVNTRSLKKKTFRSSNGFLKGIYVKALEIINDFSKYYL